MTEPVTKQDVWLALFSLDSYHRGYGVQVSTLTRSETHLGNAEIKNIGIPDGSVAAGFYAIAYDVSAVSDITGSNTVIAYRGTDYDETDGYSKFRDMLNGWSV